MFSNGSRNVILATILLCCGGVALTAQSSPSPPLQTALQALPQSMQKELEQVVAAQAVARSAPYRVQPGDELEIRAYALPDLNMGVRIRPDGRISLVLLNDVEVAGQTAEEIAQLLSSLYAKSFREPKITVIVRSFSNFHVYVGGEVVRPGLVSLSGGLTATSAIFQAGGFKDEEGPKSLILLRKGPSGVPSVLNLDLDDVLIKGKADTVLQPSDILYVPRHRINVYVGGEVVEPGLVPLSGKMTALSAILRARGLKPTAKANSVVLLRDSGQPRPIILRINLQQVLVTGRNDVELRPYDVVYVPKSTIAKIDQFVDQYIRQLLPISVNMGFSYILGVTGFIE